MLKDIAMYFIFGLIFFSPLFWYISQGWNKEHIYFSALTTIEIENSDLSLGTVPHNKTITTIFKIKNTGENPLIISNVYLSNENAQVEWNRNSIEKGDTGEIKVTFRSNKIGIFLKTLEMTCNTIAKKYQLSMRGIVDHIPNDFIYTTEN